MNKVTNWEGKGRGKEKSNFFHGLLLPWGKGRYKKGGEPRSLLSLSYREWSSSFSFSSSSIHQSRYDGLALVGPRARKDFRKKKKNNALVCKHMRGNRKFCRLVKGEEKKRVLLLAQLS